MKIKKYTFYTIIFTTLFLTISSCSSPSVGFNADRALADVEYQINLGPRTPGSDAHANFIQWLSSELESNGWEVSLQTTERLGHPLTNIIAKRGSAKPWIILGAHYDSRLLADRSAKPEDQVVPVPGANDGASGVAVLLELARSLPADLDKEVWLVFFDLEDQGNIQGWDWILGSRAFVESLTSCPDKVVIVDMIGDAELDIPIEASSDPELIRELWDVAAQLGYQNYFLEKRGGSILDDHTPFLEAGIPAIDIIDFNYPYWHTIADTADKVSANSLKVIGDTLYTWLTTK
jgi:glutaminyl-peptide cyclotransferase